MNDSQTPEQRSMPIALDAMGGDFGIEVTVEGAINAARELNISSVLVGDELRIKKELKKYGAETDSRLTIVHASDVVTMGDTPSTAVRRKPDSSLRVAYDLVKAGKASSVVSAGNTGAMMGMGLFVSGPIPGVVRPAIASLIPRVGSDTPAVLLDAGANIGCQAHQLVQFALMGSHYAQSVTGCTNPRVGLLSNGSEESKGTDLTRSAAAMMKEVPSINYVGYVEGNSISRNTADVIVCDGFIGNVLLKTMEGTVELVTHSIKHQVASSLRGRFGLWLAKPAFKSVFKSKLDPSAYGGAPLLGLNHVAIVCHGSANPRAIFNGIRVAHKFVEDKLVDNISHAVATIDLGLPGGYEDGVWERVGESFSKTKKDKAGQKKLDKQSEKEKEIKHEQNVG